jgi:hypothetical protein
MADQVIKVNVAEVAGEFRALCPFDGCRAYRQHAQQKTALEYLHGHMITKHNVQLSSVLKIK